MYSSSGNRSTSAAPPVSWVAAAWVAVLLAAVSLRWSRPRRRSDAMTSPYRGIIRSVEEPHRALLGDAVVVTVGSLHAAPLAVYVLRAWVG